MDEHRNEWREALRHQQFIIQFVTVIVLLISFLLCLPFFFHEVIGPRPGIMLNDFVLNLFSPRDYSWLIFILIYLSLAIVLQGVLLKPYHLLYSLTCYLGINLIRMITMYVLTLEPPAGIVELHDPLMDNMAYGGKIVTKDLFFSGHVATLTLLAFTENRKLLKWFVCIATSIVGVLLMMQRVHYTLDVIIAPIVTYAVIKIVGLFSVKN